MGITREISSLQNGTEIKHIHTSVWSPDPLSNISLYYDASNIGPHLNCVFIADILDYFNNSKTKNESSFSEYSIFD